MFYMLYIYVYILKILNIFLLPEEDIKPSKLLHFLSNFLASSCSASNLSDSFFCLSFIPLVSPNTKK